MVFMRRRGGPDLHQPSQLVKNSQPRWGGGGSGEVGMVSQLLPGFEFGSLPLYSEAARTARVLKEIANSVQV